MIQRYVGKITSDQDLNFLQKDIDFLFECFLCSSQLHCGDGYFYITLVKMNENE